MLEGIPNPRQAGKGIESVWVMQMRPPRGEIGRGHAGGIFGMDPSGMRWVPVSPRRLPVLEEPLSPSRPLLTSRWDQKSESGSSSSASTRLVREWMGASPARRP